MFKFYGELFLNQYQTLLDKINFPYGHLLYGELVVFERPRMTSVWSLCSRLIRNDQLSPVACLCLFHCRVFHTNQMKLVLPISLEVEPLGFQTNSILTPAEKVT
jgi:hypothetical protein